CPVYVLVVVLFRVVSFLFYCPAAHPCLHSFPTRRSSDLSMIRVLVIDDEPGLRQSLGLLLADAGYEVAAEGDGRRGLERALAESFDLILCDVRMPQMDGLTFLRSYKERGGAGLVIVMSAYGGEDAALAAMKEGA